MVYGQNKKTSFLVNGKCEMCEERIEKALDIKGVNFASWNVETKMCNVTFNQKKITEKEIHKILAAHHINNLTMLYNNRQFKDVISKASILIDKYNFSLDLFIILGVSLNSVLKYEEAINVFKKIIYQYIPHSDRRIYIN